MKLLKRLPRPRYLIVLALVTLILIALAVIIRQPPPPISAQDGWSPGYYNLSLDHDGETRTFWVYIPAGYDGSTPVPLVFGLHGGIGSGEQFARSSRMNDHANERGFIAVYPDGTGSLQTWNAGHCCGTSIRNDVDDVGYIRALVEELQARLNIDPARIYAMGMSNGAMMSYRLAAEASDVFAAVGPVAGSIGGVFRPGWDEYINTPQGGPVSLIAINGMQDEAVKYEGGESDGVFGNDRVDISVTKSVGAWVAHNDCNAVPETVTAHDGNIITDTYTCPDGIDVVLITIVDGEHAWPGGRKSYPGAPQPNQDIDATAVILDFFFAHPKP